MSYRRKRYYRNATNVIKMKFQSFMDISTSSDSMQIITISAGGKNLLERCPAQFGAYKYYKLGNISVKLVPASTLPVDPTGLSIEAGASTVDPRDQLTPGMMRITNGEDIMEDISGLSDAQQHTIYNNMLLDPRWYKWMLQRGVKRHATPRFWQIGQLHQDKWPGSITNVPLLDSDGDLDGTAHLMQEKISSGDAVNVYSAYSSPYGFFQTGHSGRLGWLPTDGMQPISNASGNLSNVPLIASPPEIEVFKILLPKAYKTRYWYRAFISETVYFREPLVTVGPINVNAMRPLDVFHYMPYPVPLSPEQNQPLPLYPNDGMTGGNYGDH